jgi:iron complex outermembrane recepter protein
MTSLLRYPRSFLLCAACSLLVAAASFAADGAPKRSFDLPADTAEKSLKAFSLQAGLDVLFSTESARSVRTNPIKGELTPQQAIDELLAGTELTAIQDRKTGAFRVRRHDPNGYRAAPRSSRPESNGDDPAEKKVELPVFEVMAGKVLNMDIRRTEDDAQPYVVFDRDAIKRSGTNDIEEFLLTRLPMNTSSMPGITNPISTIGNRSAINLRGLGTNQTLILVNGRRLASSNSNVADFARQPDINGIPMSAIERIEVLPTTASGIYGGGATGGVVNIVLRQNYSGWELKLGFEGAYEGGVAGRRVDLSGGFGLEGGRTQVFLAGSVNDRDDLIRGDRPEFYSRALERVLSNDPNFFVNRNTLPFATTTNIRSTDGSPLFGPGTSSISFIPQGYAGGGGLAPLVANAGRWNLVLNDSAATATGGAGRRNRLMGATEVTSLMATVRRQMTDNLEMFVDLKGSNNVGRRGQANSAGTVTIAASAPNNPFGKSIMVVPAVTTPESEIVTRSKTRAAAVGLIFKLRGDWAAETDYSWGRSSNQYSGLPPSFPAAARTAMSNGTLDVLRDTEAFPLDLSPYMPPTGFSAPFIASLEHATLRASGPVFSLWGGPVTLAGSLEHRKEEFDESFTRLFSGPTASTTFTYPSRSQTVSSGYAELQFPLIGSRNKLSLARELTVQLAGRHDEYTTNGVTGLVSSAVVSPTIIRTRNRTRSTNPTVSVRFTPVSDFTLRASYGSGFLPPSVDQVTPGLPFTSSGPNLRDPLRGNEPVGSFAMTTGGNPALQPEKSVSWSAGMLLTPLVLNGLRFTLDYTSIEKTDNISDLGEQDIINYFPGRVTRGAATGGFSVGPIIALNKTLENISSAEMRAFDAQLDYRFEHGSLGTFDFFAIGTRLVRYRTQLLPTSPLVDNIGITTGTFGIGTPVKVRGNIGVAWQRPEWSAGWTLRYVGSYQSIPSNNPQFLNLQGNNGRISSQVYHDVYVGHRLKPRFLTGFEVQVGAKNVFNTQPPVDLFNSFPAGHSGISIFADPRGALYYVNLTCSY